MKLKRLSPPSDSSRAWFQVFLSHLINFNSFGFMLSFGIFQGYYTNSLGFSPSNVSWIGTLQLFLVYFVGVFSGRAMDSGYYRHTLTTGVILQLLGAFTTSFCQSYYQLLLAQGLCQGLANGLLFCPAVALVSTYFPPEKRALPVSIVACGGATGGMVFPAIAQSLLPKLGFAWTMRVMAFVMLAVCAIVLPFSKPRVMQGISMTDKTAFRDVSYLLFCAGIFFGFWGLYFAYYYVRPYGRDFLHTSDRSSFFLILIINAFGIPGRVVPNFLADKYFGPLCIIIPFFCIEGILIFCWIATKIQTGFFVWVATYGFFAGGCQSLFQASASTFSDNPKAVGFRVGFVCTVVSFACLTGPPVAGHLIERMGGDYLAAQIFGATVMLLGGGFLLGAWLLQRKQMSL